MRVVILASLSLFMIFGTHAPALAEDGYNFTPFGIRVERLPDNPMLTLDMFSEDRTEHSLMSGCLIKVPSWVENPLGKYYLYSAQHHGRDHLDLSYSDNINGPWTVYEPGVLPIEETCDGEVDHISAPDVHVVDDQQRFVMFFHGMSSCYGHHGSIALSDDGVTWHGTDYWIPAYFVVKQAIDGKYYGVGKKGELFRSDSLITDRGTEKHSDRYAMIYKLPEDPIETIKFARHSSLRLVQDTMYVLYSNRGDTLEHLKVIKVVNFTDPDTSNWIVSEGQSLLRPEYDWEGVNFPIKVSAGGHTGKHELRDPKVYTVENQDYLCYSVAAESGVAIARIFFPGVDYGNVSTLNREPQHSPLSLPSYGRHRGKVFTLNGRTQEPSPNRRAAPTRQPIVVSDDGGTKLETEGFSGDSRR